MLQQEIMSYIFKITFYSRGAGPDYQAIVEMCNYYEYQNSPVIVI